MSAASRRRLLGGVGALLAGGAIPMPVGAAPESDAELIKACQQFEALEWRYLGLFYGPGRIEDDDERNVVIDPIYREQDDLAEAIADMKATTLDGFRALSRATIIWAPDEIEPSEYHALHDDLRNLLLRSLVGEEWFARVIAALGRPQKAVVAAKDIQRGFAGEEAS